MAKSIAKTLEEPAWWRSRKWTVLVVFLILLMGLLAYCNCFTAPFILDDPDQITNNPGIKEWWPPWVPMTYGGQLTRPILYFTLAVNYAISELRPWSYHIFNLAVHVLAAMALYGLVSRTLLMPRLRERFAKHAPVLAMIVAMIWLVHPMLTSAVTYVVQRAESMMGLMYLLTLYCSVRAITSQRPATWFWFALAAVACAVGMGCKQIMVTAPLMVLAYDWTFMRTTPPERRRLMIYFVLVAMIAGLVIFKGALARMLGLGDGAWVLHFVAALPVLGLVYDMVSSKTLSPQFRQRIALYLGVAAAGYAVLALTLSVTPMDDTAGFEMRNISWWQYGLTELGVHVKYLALAFVPHPLCLDYELPTINSIVEVWPYAIIIAALLGLTVWGLIKRPELGFLGLWYFLILAPSSSIMPIKDKIFEFRVYVSLAALIALLVFGAYRLGVKYLPGIRPGARKFLDNNLSAAVCASIGVSLVGMIWAALFVYGLLPGFIQTAGSVVDLLGSPNRGSATHSGLMFVAGGLMVLIPLAVIFLAAKLAMRVVFPESAEDEDEDEDENPAGAGWTGGMGVSAVLVLVLMSMSILRNYDYRSEESIWRQTLQLRPLNPRAHSNMGVVLLLAGKTEEGLWHLHESINCDPTFQDALYNLGVMGGKMGKVVESLYWYKRCLAVDGRYLTARFNLAVAYQEINRPTDALAEYMIMLQQDKNHLGALHNAAVILKDTGRAAQALPMFLRVLELDPNGNPQAYLNLADCYRKLGMYKEEAQTLRTLEALRRQAAQKQAGPAYKR